MALSFHLRYRWTTSRHPDTMGWNICTLFVNGDKVASCNGGGYDLMGTCLGDWIVKTFSDRLRKLKTPFYGLTFHNPMFDVGTAVLASGQTVAEKQAAGGLVDLDVYQQFHAASVELPSKTHTIPSLDGACGFDSMRKVLLAIGCREMRRTKGGDDAEFYVTMTKNMPRAKPVAV